MPACKLTESDLATLIALHHCSYIRGGRPLPPDPPPLNPPLLIAIPCAQFVCVVRYTCASALINYSYLPLVPASMSAHLPEVDGDGDDGDG